ncbi:MAG: chorismate-binding protein [Burkholderiales bacterium]|jgi:para-aminobenzoate synthetase/4-amino-4-deoxychorismate lyase|nr:chorismate-binding protein [Burkholderiales bacterium]
MTDAPAPFLLLDDRSAAPGVAASRLYAPPLDHAVCTDAAQFDAFCADIDAVLAAGRHVALVARYGLGFSLLGLAPPHGPDGPLLEALIVDAPQRLTRTQVDAWLATQAGAASADALPAATLVDLAPRWDFARYADAFAVLQRAIADGDCYQGNLTFACDARVVGPPAALHARLAAAQPTPFAAFARLASAWIVSASPELFVARDGPVLRAKPMKGTAARDTDPQRLRDDAKTRAENVMIVDLLRNDLGRIAATGSVHVPALFDLEALPTAWQMTSTVEARRDTPLPLAALLRALFPCGSVTGAPKRRAMQVLAAAEGHVARGVYCGAIGWLDPGGDFRFSVPIRTLELDAAGQRARLGVGSGVVADSRAADEYAECLLKTRFARAFDPGFALFETLRVEAGGALRVDAHLARLAASAAAFGFAFDRARVLAAIVHTARNATASPARLRVQLAHDGTVQTTLAPLEPLTEPVDVLLATARVRSDDPWLAHKTTQRAAYDAAIREAQARGAFDMIFCNEHDEVAEGARSAVFARIDGHWCTPPLACGALPSVMRAVLLSDPQLAAREVPIPRDALLRADALIVANSVRGALRARLVTTTG